MAATNITPNAQTAVSFFQSKGWTKEQSAGIVANLQAESGVNLNPKAFNPAGGGKGAAGLAQWRGQRQTNFETFAGKPLSQATLQEQLAFVDHELKTTEKAAGTKLKATKSAADAAAVVNAYYERSGGSAESKRIGYANNLVGVPTTTPPTGTPTPAAKVEPQSEISYTPSNPTDYIVLPDSDVTKKRPAEPDYVDTTKPLMNDLHQYSSYTYGLSLHLLTADEFNEIVTTQQYTPKRVLISSAGRYNNVAGPGQFIRSKYFDDDFYFDNLTMTTVIGVNETYRNTNAIELAFTLIEPYGMTLVNRLIDQANDPDLQCSNYLDMPYLVQIDFFASNDAGELVGVIPGMTKRIPVKITQMDIKAGVKGAEYQIKAVPVNHSAYNLSTISTPANFEIVAGTVGQFFQSNQSSKSLSTALNAWNSDLAQNNKIGAADTYGFNIDSVIANSPFTSSATVNPMSTSMADVTGTSSIRRSNTGNATSDFDAAAKSFSINAGTSIEKVIDQVMRNSDYIQNQVTIPDGMDPQTYLEQKAKNANQALNWYKIVPTVTLGAFDPIRKVYARNVVYNVVPYQIKNVKSDVAPQGVAETPVKAYNFIYSGINDDVIDFDINFNTLYYTAQTAYRDAVTDIYNTASGSSENYLTKNSDTYQGSTQDPNSLMPNPVKPTVYNAKSRAAGGAVTAKAVAVADLEDSLMTMSSADMLSLKLKILGDPQFIKQDDCFYTPSSLQIGDDPRLTPNGSLRTDYSEIYAQLTFRTPVDIDESTGLMRFESKYRTSVFSGLYRVLTVESEFRNGMFTQTLDLIRLSRQVKFDYVGQNSTTTVSDQRNTDLKSDIVPQTNILNAVAATTSSGLPSVGDVTGQIQAQKLPGVQQLVGAATGALDAAQQQLRNVNQSAVTAAITDATAPLRNLPTTIRV